MFTGGEESSFAAMAGLVSSTSNPHDDNSDMAACLLALTPHPNNYVVKYLSDANGDESPIFGEYFGVALAFAALGALIRESKSTPEAKLCPMLQRLDLQVMMKSVTDRFQTLATNAQDLEQKVHDCNEETRKDVEAWEAERLTLVRKLSSAEAQIARVERTRHEDAKANERVAGVFASYEQTWKNEKKKLKREVELLRDEIVGLRNRNTPQIDGGEDKCEGCKAKAQLLVSLEGQLCEKEFHIASAMEESRADQVERNLLAGKLEKLSKEMTKNAELLEALADVRRKYEETQNKLMCAMSQLDNARREIESLSAARTNQNAMIEELLDNLKSLQHNVNEKEEVISVLTKRSSNDQKEKEELLQQLAQAKSKRKASEAEKDRWKRLAEERARNVASAGRDPRTRRSLGSKMELDKLSEIQRSHNEEVHGLRFMYRTKLESLQRELRDYEEKITLLEARILIHSTQNSQSQKRKTKHEEQSSSGKKARESVNCHDIVALLESVVPEVDAMQLEGFESEIQEVPMTPVALKDWLKKWLQVVKIHHARYLEKRHAREVDAFERQMRMKDERLESFRRHLLRMESSFSKMKSDLEELESMLAMAVEEKTRAERTVELKDKEVQAFLETMLRQSGEAMALDQLSHHDSQQRVLVFLQNELNDARKKLEEVEAEHRKTLLKFAEDTEVELKLKDHMLDAAETRLCQLRIRIDNETRFTPERTPEASFPAVVHDKAYSVSVVGAQEVDIKNAISTACSEVEKLAGKIAEVRKQMAESDENYDSGLEELMDQVTAVSNSGKKLSMLRNAISTKELNDTKITLFKDFQITPVQLEAPLSPAMGQETLDQPRGHAEEPSTSGTNSGAPEVSEEGIASVDADPEVNSKRQLDVDIGFSMETTNSKLEIFEEDERTDLMTLSERKRERRKTLKEYFLNSPPDTVNPLPALELQVPSKDPPVLSFSSPGVLQTTGKSTLAATQSTSQQDNMTPRSPSNSPRPPPPFASPLFDRIKSRRREFNKTREDIQVLGLALEVRKIEEQLFEINRGCASQPDATVNPKIGSSIARISSGRFNKRYSALTGKVGHFAKQMGLTSAEKTPADMVTDHPHFSKSTPLSEMVSLKDRAEAVAQSLAALETQAAEASSQGPHQQTGYSKERLIDTVKTHLSQVQRILRARLAPLNSRQQSFGLPLSPLKERM